MAICKAEGCGVETDGGRSYCYRHFSQLRDKGEIVSVARSYKKPNELVFLGDTVEIVLRTKMGDEIGRALIDADDAELVSERKWYLHSKGYCASKGKLGACFLHKLILPGDEQVDHINGNKLDNRKSNLRKCNGSQNHANYPACKNSKTGVRGVYPVRNGFEARIRKDGTLYRLGIFETVEDGERAYNAKAIELFGEFAYCQRKTEG